MSHAQSRPSIGELVDRSRSLQAFLSERAAATETASRVSAEQTEAIKQVGLHRVSQPEAFGGYGYGPSAVFRTSFELARSCPSTAWCTMVANSNAWFASYWPLEVQQEVWDADPDAMIAISGIPLGKGRCVDGGYEIWGVGRGRATATIANGPLLPPRSPTRLATCLKRSGFSFR